MVTMRRVRRTLGLVLCLSLVGVASARAQSVITGTVRDTSGAVLPGVSVEVSSPALIEQKRTTVTEGNGQFRIVDLRPGTYTIVFSLEGFETVRHEGVQLPSDFTATIDGLLKVGALEESVIVSGSSPVVDVASTARTQVVTREVLDAIPTGRSVQSFAALVPSVRMDSLDVGGARGSTQTYMTIRGLDRSQSHLFIEGMPVSPLLQSTTYYSDIQNQEISYQTTSLPADTSQGGARLNMIPRDGGNKFSGTFVGSYKDGDWQGSNLTQRLIDRGLTRIDSFEKIYDVDGGIGGPILQNKLWFFTSHRRLANDTPVFNSYYPDGSPGIQDDRTWADQLRLTYQVNQKNRLVGYWNYTGKAVGHQLTPGTEPRASVGWYAPNYLAAYAKLTSTISPRVLLEVGPSVGNLHHKFPMQDGVEQVPYTPAWYSTASRVDLDAVTRTVAPQNTTYNRPGATYVNAAISYVTGTHNVKVGTTVSWGHYEHTYTGNADLVQQYRSGVPDSVLINNLPITSAEKNNGTHAVFAQDTWHLKRLTLSGGLRWETVTESVPAQDSPAGRFVAARHFDAIDNIIDWKNFAPRFGAAYDLFGNGKTALKYSLNRYNQWDMISFAQKYNPLALVTAQLRWTDLNGDDIAQGAPGCTYRTAGCEIDFSTLPSNFGARALSVAQDLQRPYTIENGFEVQHELLQGFSVSGSFYRGDFHNIPLSYNSLRTFADYTPVQIYNPRDGSPMTVYNLNPAKATAVAIIDTSSDQQKKTYTGFTLGFNARLPRGVTAFGGFNTERVLQNNCVQPDDPNLQILCDDWKNNLPWQPSLKLSGSVPVWKQIMVSGSWQNLQGYNPDFSAVPSADGHQTGTPSYGSYFLITRTTRYPAGCPSPCPAGQLVLPTLTQASLRIPLDPYGSVFTERVNEVELRISRSFRAGKTFTVEPRVEIFNLLNHDAITAYRSVSFGTPSYLQPSALPPARFIGFGLQVRY
jgi:hypothetical protein